MIAARNEEEMTEDDEKSESKQNGVNECQGSCPSKWSAIITRDANQCDRVLQARLGFGKKRSTARHSKGAIVENRREKQRCDMMKL